MGIAYIITDCLGCKRAITTIKLKCPICEWDYGKEHYPECKAGRLFWVFNWKFPFVHVGRYRFCICDINRELDQL